MLVTKRLRLEGVYHLSHFKSIFQLLMAVWKPQTPPQSIPSDTFGFGIFFNLFETETFFPFWKKFL